VGKGWEDGRSQEIGEAEVRDVVVVRVAGFSNVLGLHVFRMRFFII
jgi:hypothetical protein